MDIVSPAFRLREMQRILSTLFRFHGETWKCRRTLQSKAVGGWSASGRTRRPLPGVPTIQPTKPITIYPGNRAPESEFVLLRAERTERIYNNKELLVAQPVIGILDCGDANR